MKHSSVQVPASTRHTEQTLYPNTDNNCQNLQVSCTILSQKSKQVFVKIFVTSIFTYTSIIQFIRHYKNAHKCILTKQKKHVG